MSSWPVVFMRQWRRLSAIEHDLVQWQTIVNAALVKEGS